MYSYLKVKLTLFHHLINKLNTTIFFKDASNQIKKESEWRESEWRETQCEWRERERRSEWRKSVSDKKPERFLNFLKGQKHVING